MTNLLDLPTEVLEIVLIEATRTEASFLSPLRMSPSVPRLAAVKKALPLRLVHPVMKALVDALVYSSFHHIIDESPTHIFDVPNGTCKTLLCPSLAQHIKYLYLSISSGTETTPDLLDHLVAIFGPCSTHLHYLRLYRKNREGRTRFLPLPRQTLQFPSLRILVLGYPAFALRLPLMARQAPSLELVWVYGRSALSYQSTQIIVDKYASALPGGYHLTRPIRRLCIYDFHTEWMQCLLANIRPDTGRVHLNIGGNPKVYAGSAAQHLSSFSHLAESSHFNIFEVQFTSRRTEKPSAKAVRQYRDRVEPVYADLVASLQQEWRGLGKEIFLDTPKADSELLSNKAAVRWGDLFEKIRIVT